VINGSTTLKGFLDKIEKSVRAHIFIAFVTYCLHVTLRQQLRALASGLTPAAVLEKFATMHMLDVHLPITDHRQLVLSRDTQPDKDLSLVLQVMNLTLREQPPPRIYAYHVRAS